jgi:hypothetical protein
MTGGLGEDRENPGSAWCPSCGAEYSVATAYCSDCRVTLVSEPPDGAYDQDGDIDPALADLGDYGRLNAQILRRRLETAGLSVMVRWTGAGGEATGTIFVPERDAQFAEAVINEIDVDDEVPDTSPEAYIARIEEHMAAVGSLLEELRTRLEETSD